jgi:hypothetical protein
MPVQLSEASHEIRHLGVMYGTLFSTKFAWEVNFFCTIWVIRLLVHALLCCFVTLSRVILGGWPELCGEMEHVHVTY